MNSIRFFDFTISLIAIIVLSPFFVLISIIIKLTSKGSVLFAQKRVGKNNVDFELYKFRSMKADADKNGLLTIGGKDNRITAIGYYLRKLKFDELPQLFNVLKGEMSLVGPRPEVRKYVNYYTAEQMKVLNVVPGITDYASMAYKNENELLAASPDPEKFYVEVVMPEKIRLNQRFIAQRNLRNYFAILFHTVFGLFRKKVKNTVAKN